MRPLNACESYLREFLIANWQVSIADFSQQLEIGNRQSEMVLGGTTKDESIKVGIVAKGVQIVVVLSTHAKIWL